MNTFRRNLACKCRPWVCSSTPNLALIGKRWSVQESPKYQNLSKIVFVFGHRKPTQWTHSDEIWRVSIDHVCTVSYQIWPGSVKEQCYNSAPKCKKLGRNCNILAGFCPSDAIKHMLCCYTSICVDVVRECTCCQFCSGSVMLIMVALWNRADHYIFILWFLLLSYGRPM